MRRTVLLVLAMLANLFASPAVSQLVSPFTTPEEAIAAYLDGVAQRDFDAATSHPQLVAGTGHFDMVAMTAFGGRLMQKGGADGVQCGAIRDKGWGYALKCDDGSLEASVVMVANLLAKYAEPKEAERVALARFARQDVRNIRGTVVGEMRGAGVLG